MAIGSFSDPLWDATGTTDTFFACQLLAKHKYLTGDDVVTVMTHYESLADIGP